MTNFTKLLIGSLLAKSMASAGFAQILPELPSGINDFAPDAPNAASYAAAFNPGPSTSNLYFDSTANVPSIIQGSTWSNGPINLATIFGGNPWKPDGGSVKTIFLGTTAGWADDFGYISSTAPSTFNPLITDIRSNNIPMPDGNIVSGWSTSVNYAAGTTLDFGNNSGGDVGQGGLFFAFGTANRFSGSDMSNHVRWTTQDVNTTYFNGMTTVTTPVKTLLVGFEDTRLGVSFYDGDFNDTVVAFQFLPTVTPPVPEPSTYSLLGGIALVSVIALRRRRPRSDNRLTNEAAPVLAFIS